MNTEGTQNTTNCELARSRTHTQHARPFGANAASELMREVVAAADALAGCLLLLVALDASDVDACDGSSTYCVCERTRVCSGFPIGACALRGSVCEYSAAYVRCAIVCERAELTMLLFFASNTVVYSKDTT